jgi:hypothetical protein
MKLLVTGPSCCIGSPVAIAASDTMGSSGRVRAVRARRELGWAPHRQSLRDATEHTARQRLK